MEDLGRATREITLTAFVIGPDYLAQHDKLLGAIEEAGPGTLVHPWYGSLTVCVKDQPRVSLSHEEGGMARFQLSFVEAGELSFPSATDAPGSKTNMAADGLQQAAIADFSLDFDVLGYPEFVYADAMQFVTGSLGGLGDALGMAQGILVNPVDSLLGLLPNLLPNPADLATSFFGLFDGVGGLLSTVSGRFTDADQQNTDRVASVIRAVSSFPIPGLPANVMTPSRARMVTNRTAVQALVRRTLLVQAARMVAAMSLPVYDDAQALRSSLTGALDTESLTAADAPYTALNQLRVAVHQDVAARVAGAARLSEYRPQEVLPAAVIAYELYENVDREGEIALRNRIHHPGFVPVEPLKVLSA